MTGCIKLGDRLVAVERLKAKTVEELKIEFPEVAVNVLAYYALKEKKKIKKRAER